MSIQENQLQWMKESYATQMKKEILEASIEEIISLIIVEENENFWRFSIHPNATFDKKQIAKEYYNYIQSEPYSESEEGTKGIVTRKTPEDADKEIKKLNSRKK